MPLSSTDSILSACRLCHRHCGIDRTRGQKGYCRAGAEARVAMASLHQWEEPCISGARGSGTVFFSGCNLSCVYCQNADISQYDHGKDVTAKQLAQMFLSLQERGAHNLNLVTPTPHILQIIEALDTAKAEGFCIPVIYNTSTYETSEALSLLNGWVDVYLPDLKYYDDSLSRSYSDAPGYFHHAAAAIGIMLDQVGPCRFNEEGMLQKGVLIRHLLLPGGAEDSRRALRHIRDAYGDSVWFSLMNQYTPHHRAAEYPELRNPPTAEEYESLIDYALELGLENGFIQEEGACSEQFIPPFDIAGISSKTPMEEA